MPLLLIALAAVPIATESSTPLPDQAPDAKVYADAARHLAQGEGYVTDVGPGESHTPQYPPGFALALAPFVKWGGDFPESAQFASRLLAMLLLVAACLAAWVMGGPAAAALTAVIVGISPFASSMARVVMSDALAASLTVLVLALLARTSRARSAAAGAVASAGLAVRATNAATVLSLLVGLKRPRLIAAALAGCLPLVVAVLVWQWSEFGTPLRTGYAEYSSGFTAEAFSPRWALRKELAGDGSFFVHDRARGALTRWTCPCRNDNPMNGLSNALFYPAVLLGFYWVYAPPFLTLVGLWELFHRRRSAAGRFAIVLLLSTLLMLIPYWSRGARLVAPAAMVLVVFTALGLLRLGARLVERARQDSNLRPSVP